MDQQNLAAGKDRKQLKRNTNWIKLWGTLVTARSSFESPSSAPPRLTCDQIPMLLLPTLLLGLVLARSTSNNPSSATEFPFNADETSTSSDSYFVKMNATTLLTISTWSSTLTPILGAALMHLWSYRAASSISKHSQDSDKLDLPSPYQFAMILEMTKGV